ncbi:hypothetical protein [Fimbriiglobus ruber]|nr:hypothetical protein [Fimbriiglobus ruber]
MNRAFEYHSPVYAWTISAASRQWTPRSSTNASRAARSGNRPFPLTCRGS